MKILVSGGAGFIGHNVVRRLESLGNEVIILDNLTTYGITKKKLLKRLMYDRMAGVAAHRLESDIATGIARTHIDIHKPDIIIHLASFPRAKIVNANPEVAVPTMTTGLMNLLIAGARNNVKRFVYISSSMVYGDFNGGLIFNRVQASFSAGKRGLSYSAINWMISKLAYTRGERACLLRCVAELCSGSSDSGPVGVRVALGDQL